MPPAIRPPAASRTTPTHVAAYLFVSLMPVSYTEYYGIAIAA